jgi:hypothetical protein
MDVYLTRRALAETFAAAIAEAENRRDADCKTALVFPLGGKKTWTG